MLETMNFYKHVLQKLRNLALSMRNDDISSSNQGTGKPKKMRQYIKEIEAISTLISSMLADLYEVSKKSDYLKSNNITSTIGAANIEDNTNNGVASEIEFELTAALRDINLKLDAMLANSASRVSYHLNELNIKLDNFMASNKKIKDSNKKHL